MEIDASVYPDEDPPTHLSTMEEKAEYVHRICGAFDFGLPPDCATIRLFAGWRSVFDRYRLSNSPAYHAFRAFYGWEPVARSKYFGEPGYAKLDAAEGREDGFEDRV